MVFDFGPNLTQILIALIAVIPAIIAAFYARSAARQSTEAVAQTQATLIQGRATNQLVNGRMTELLELTRASAKSAGIAEGIAGGPVSVPTPETKPE